MHIWLLRVLSHHRQACTKGMGRAQ
jgi:hypothetical protein